MSGFYEGHGVSFRFPQNWLLEQADDGEEATLQVTVSSPDTAFWSLSIYPGQRDVRLLLEEVLQAMQAEYPGLEHHAADQRIDRHVLVGYDLHFYYLDLTNTAIARVFQLGPATCLLLAQAEDHEMPTAGQVFAAITASLLSDTPAEADADGL